MPYSVAEAAEAIGKSKTTVLRAIAAGRISALRDDAGAFQIEPAELHRHFGPPPPAAEQALQHGAPHREDFSARLAAAEAENAAMQDAARLRDETIADLRRRLDQADADRRQALDRLAASQERIAALLTDQRQVAPARRRWWHWRS